MKEYKPPCQQHDMEPNEFLKAISVMVFIVLVGVLTLALIGYFVFK